MEDNNDKKLPPHPVKEVDNFKWIIPECCEKGWKTCKHVAKPQKPAKTNIGL